MLYRLIGRKNPAHRIFWAVAYIPGPVVYILYLGLFCVTWTEFDRRPRWGGWNLD